MPAPMPVASLFSGVANVLRARQLHADLHRATAPIHYPLRNIGAASTSSIVWALASIVISASLLGLAALFTARHRARNANPPPALRSLPSRRDHSHPRARAA